MLWCTHISTRILALGFLMLGFYVPSWGTSLFSIGRSKDADEIFYAINLTDPNKINVEAPIDVYWLRRTKNDKVEPLTWVQNKFAYGIVYVSKSDSYAKFRFAAYDERTFELKKNEHDEFRVFTTLDNEEVELNRIFIHITGGTFWIPQIPKVEVYSKVTGSNKALKEIITP